MRERQNAPGVRLERPRAQRLAPRDAAAAPVEIVRHLIGLQAQLPSAAGLAVRVRTSGLHAGDVQRDAAPGGPCPNLADAELFTRRRGRPGCWASLPRTCWRAVAGMLGLDSGTLARAIDVRTAGRATPGYPRGVVRRAGRARHRSGRPTWHPSGAACGSARVAHLQADQGHEQTWIRREVSTTQPVDDREEALATLARRYHSAYGPAGPRDLAAWSGLSITEACRACR